MTKKKKTFFTTKVLCGASLIGIKDKISNTTKHEFEIRISGWTLDANNFSGAEVLEDLLKNADINKGKIQ